MAAGGLARRDFEYRDGRAARRSEPPGVPLRDHAHAARQEPAEPLDLDPGAVPERVVVSIDIEIEDVAGDVAPGDRFGPGLGEAVEERPQDGLSAQIGAAGSPEENALGDAVHEERAARSQEGVEPRRVPREDARELEGGEGEGLIPARVAGDGGGPAERVRQGRDLREERRDRAARAARRPPPERSSGSRRVESPEARLGVGERESGAERRIGFRRGTGEPGRGEERSGGALGAAERRDARVDEERPRRVPRVARAAEGGDGSRQEAARGAQIALGRGGFARGRERAGPLERHRVAREIGRGRLEERPRRGVFAELREGDPAERARVRVLEAREIRQRGEREPGREGARGREVRRAR